MIAVDASVVVDFLTAAETNVEIVALIGGSDLLVAPFLIDLEVVNVLRKRSLSGTLDRRSADRAYRNYLDIRIFRHSVLQLLDKIWLLRPNLTPYDAAYVVVAEALSVPLYTRDRRLSRSVGHQAIIRHV